MNGNKGSKGSTHIKSPLQQGPAPRNLPAKGTVPDVGKLPSGGETGGQKK